MKLAQINLARGMFIPGLGNTIKVTDVECVSMDVGGVHVVTPTAKVILPWQNIESVVTEWIALKDPPKVAESVGKVAYVPNHQAGNWAPGIAEQLQHPGQQSVAAMQLNPPLTMQEFEATEAGKATAQATRQPPPPTKKGGRK